MAVRLDRYTLTADNHRHQAATLRYDVARRVDDDPDAELVALGTIQLWQGSWWAPADHIDRVPDSDPTQAPFETMIDACEDLAAAAGMNPATAPEPARVRA